MQSKVFIFVLCITILSLLGNAYFAISDWQYREKEKADHAHFHDQEKLYPLLSKRILNEYPIDVLVNFYPLRKKLHEITAGYEQGSFALYFEYLPTGTSIGVNEKEDYEAASLFKLPVIMAYYHMKNRTHMLKDPDVTITKDQIDDRFGNLWKKGIGTKINLADAVKLGLVDSDNTAVKTLVPFILDVDFKNVYAGLDIDLRMRGDRALLSTKQYASILKSLYFSAVLEKEDSQEILDYMTETKFTDKLPAGIPKDVRVAHKIGVIEGEAYMDCGIVYVPRRPYVLCMISKTDEAKAQIRMKYVSKMIYDYIASINK